VALRLTGTPVTRPNTASSCFGVPNRCRASLSIESHFEEFKRLYVTRELEIKVDGEMTNENGSPKLATGGTWELIGNDTIGLAVERPPRSKAVAEIPTDSDTMAVFQVSLATRHKAIMSWMASKGRDR